VVGTPVPIASIHKDRHSCAGKEHVDNDGEVRWAGNGPEAKAKFVNSRPQCPFGARVFLTIGTHDRTHSRGGCPGNIRLAHGSTSDVPFPRKTQPLFFLRGLEISHSRMVTKLARGGGVEPTPGFEPGTFSLPRKCSTA
jgi:hypothetical protein